MITFTINGINYCFVKHPTQNCPMIARVDGQPIPNRKDVVRSFLIPRGWSESEILCTITNQLERTIYRILSGETVLPRGERTQSTKHRQNSSNQTSYKAYAKDYSFMASKELRDTEGENNKFLRFVRQHNLQTAILDDTHPGSNHHYLVLLNKDNSNIIEGLIDNDDAYIDLAKMIYLHKKAINDNVFDRYDYDSVFAVVRAIDVENSTNVWRFNRGALIDIVNFIINPDNRFWELLEQGDKYLIDRLSSESDSENVEPKSLASKVCKYFVQYEMEDYDKFFINDSFVRHVTPYYYNYYLCNGTLTNHKTPITYTFISENYVNLYDALLEIYDEINKNKPEEERINKHQLDHLMWYCYKNSGK